MLDGVLDEREQHHGWKVCREKLIRHGNAEPEPSSHPDLLRVEVGPRQPDFPPQRRAVVAHSRQRCAQVTTEAVEHRPAPRWIGLVEPLDVSKRVEQEVRLDLRLQHLQSRLEYLRFDSMSLELRFAQFRGASCRALDKVVRSYDETPLEHDHAERMN